MSKSQRMILIKEGKAVSKLMGHAKEIITMDVYGDNKNIIVEETPELLEYMDEVMPDNMEAGTQDILDVEIDINDFMDVEA